MTIRLRWDHLLIILIILGIFAAGLGLGWFVFARNPTQDDQAEYYRGIYDLCRFMVAASGDYVDCNKMAGVAHDFKWFEEESAGWQWPMD